MTGPFDSSQQANETAAVQEIYRAFAADPGVGKMAPHTRRMLDEACASAHVSLGAYDRRIIAWLSGFEPETCAVVAGLIVRAYEAGPARAAAGVTLTPAQLGTVLDALADAETYRMQCAAEFCHDCQEHPSGACEDHLDDVDAAQVYEALATELGGEAT